jgi:CBS domain-containing protein
MTHCRVGNVMTRDVVSVRVRTPFHLIVELMSTRQVSSVPVLGATETVLGVVSEVDLLRKYQAAAAGYRPPWWARIRGRVWLRTTDTVAEDVMNAPAITVDVDANIGSAVRLLIDRNLKRLPVVDASGHLVGIVSRNDLVRVFVRSDDDIQAEINEYVLVGALSVDPRAARAEVLDGVVTMHGELERGSMVPLALHLVWSVDGVVAVTDQLTFALDDSPGSAGVAEVNPRPVAPGS